MKLSALEEILNGRLQEILEREAPTSEVMQKRRDREYEHLTETLTKKQETLLENFLFEESGVQGERENYYFKLGFRYGLLSAMESVFMEDWEQPVLIREKDPPLWVVEKEGGGEEVRNR